jgi:hypothetical protein
MRRSNWRRIALAVFAVVLLPACGAMPEPAPPTESPTSPPAVTTPESAAATASPQSALTLGELASRVNSAWEDVESFQVTSTSQGLSMPAPQGTPVASPVATPGATPVSRQTVEIVFARDVILPDLQRQGVSGLGSEDHEAIVSGDTIFVRGPLAEELAPGTPPDSWISLSACDIPVGSVLAHALGGLPALPPAPLAAFPERVLTQEVRELGSEEFEGRDCQLFGAADTVTTTGTRVDYAIAIDDQDLPCFIETSSGGVVLNRSEFRDINGVLDIATPAATPVGVPPAMATPAIHD